MPNWTLQTVVTLLVLVRVGRRDPLSLQCTLRFNLKRATPTENCRKTSTRIQCRLEFPLGVGETTEFPLVMKKGNPSGEPLRLGGAMMVPLDASNSLYFLLQL